MTASPGSEIAETGPGDDAEAASLAQQAYNTIERMMIRGEFSPGMLLTEVSVSQEIGIGRTPVREALQRLAGNRLVTVLPRRGAVVSSIDAAAYMSILEMRRVVEREIAAIVAREACRAQRLCLSGLALDMRDAVTEGDIWKAIEIDRRFKLVQFDACDNMLLTSAVRPLHALSRRFYFAQARRPVPQVALSLAQLMDVVARGDADGARSASDAFIDAIEAFGRRVSGRAPLAGSAAPPAPPDEEQSLADTAYREIEHRIITGHYVAGEILSGGRICEELGLGRTPVREALQRLEAHHLLSILPRRGLVVTDFGNFNLSMLVEARRPLESLLARRVALRALPAQRAALADLIDPWLAAAERGDNAAVMDLDLRMKALLLAAGRDMFLADAIRPIHSLARALYFRHQTVTDIDVARCQIDVLRAIVAGDIEEAGLAAQRFVAESVHAIRRNTGG